MNEIKIKMFSQSSVARDTESGAIGLPSSTYSVVNSTLFLIKIYIRISE